MAKNLPFMLSDIIYPDYFGEKYFSVLLSVVFCSSRVAAYDMVHHCMLRWWVNERVCGSTKKKFLPVFFGSCPCLCDDIEHKTLDADALPHEKSNRYRRVQIGTRSVGQDVPMNHTWT